MPNSTAARLACGPVYLLIVATLPMLSGSVGLAQSSSPRYSRTVQVGDLAREELSAVILDPAIYAASRFDYSDLRLLDEHDREVPFLLQQVTQRRTEEYRQTWTAKDIALRPQEDGGLEIVVNLDQRDPSPSGLIIRTPLRDFEQRVQVFGIRSAGDETLLVDDALIFDYSRYMDVRRHEVRLPAHSYRQFRLTVDKVTDQQQAQLLDFTRRLQGGEETERTERFTVEQRPFRIERIEFWQDLVRELRGDPRTADYPLVEWDAVHDAESKQTRVSLTTRREPLTRLTLETASRNFSRQVRLEVPEVRGIRTEWRTLAQRTLSRIDFRDLSDEQLTLEFPETRHTEMRLVIENGDSPPLNITGIQARGNVHRLAFFAEPKSTYRVIYGSDQSEAARYDTTALSAALANGYEPLVATMGDPTEDPTAGPRTWGLPRLVNDPRLLTGITVLLVMLLGWALYRATRRLDTLSDQ